MRFFFLSFFWNLARLLLKNQWWSSQSCLSFLVWKTPGYLWTKCWHEILKQDELLIFPCNRKTLHILPCSSQGRISFTSSIYYPLPLLWCSSAPHITCPSLLPSCLPPNCPFCADTVTGYFSQMNTFSLIFKSEYSNILIRNHRDGASLVAQWFRICLPIQGTRVRSLVREDPTGCGATKPLHHNYWALCSRARKPQLLSPRAAITEACVPRARAPQQEKPPQWEAHTPQRRVAPACRN